MSRQRLVLQGPSGTELLKQGLGGVHNAFDARGRAAQGEVYDRYIDGGASVMVANTYSRFRDVDAERIVPEEWRILVDTVRQSTGLRAQSEVYFAVSIGSMNDANNLEKAPDQALSFDFFRQQAEIIRGLNSLNSKVVLAEAIPAVSEAQGQARAFRDAGLECFISFYLGADGNLVSGESLEEAIRRVDEASQGHPLGYLVNCCPPQAIKKALEGCSSRYLPRLVGAYPNAATNEAAELDGVDYVVGVEDPASVAGHFRYLLEHYPNLRIVGGCCGHDPESVSAIAKAHLYEVVEELYSK